MNLINNATGMDEAERGLRAEATMPTVTAKPKPSRKADAKAKAVPIVPTGTAQGDVEPTGPAASTTARKSGKPASASAAAPQALRGKPRNREVGASDETRRDALPAAGRSTAPGGRPARAQLTIVLGKVGDQTTATLKTTKAYTVLKLLRSPKGTTVAAIMEATGWQAHSVRGVLSGHVKKKLALTVTSEVGKDGLRRYRIDDVAKAG